MSVVRQLYSNPRLSEDLYAVVDNMVIVDSGIAVDTIGTSTGYVWMADNGTGGTSNKGEVAIVDGAALWIVDIGASPQTVTQVTQFSDTSTFITPTSVCFLDGYFIVTEKDSDTFWISGLYDGDAWDALDFAANEGSSDGVKCCFAMNRDLWVFGTKSTQVYYNSGDDFPFTRRTFIECGINAPASVAKYKNSLFWLSDAEQVVMVDSGYSPRVVSTPAIDYWIQSGTDSSDAIGMCWQKAIPGHPLYVLQLPTVDKTFAYDISTGFWFQLSTGVSGGRHISNCHAMHEDVDIVGGYNTTKAYTLEMDQYTDDGTSIVRTRRTPFLSNDNQKIFYDEIRVYFESGPSIGSAMNVNLNYSDDGGHTWNSADGHLVSATEYGDYLVYRQIDDSRNRVWEITTSSPSKFVMLDAYAKMRGGTN